MGITVLLMEQRLIVNRLLNHLIRKGVPITDEWLVSRNDFMAKVLRKRKLRTKVSYITLERCIKILEDADTATGRYAYTEIMTDPNKRLTIMDVNNDILVIGGHKFEPIRVPDADGIRYSPYIQGSVVSSILGHKDHVVAEIACVNKANRLTYGEIVEKARAIGHSSYYDLAIDKSTIGKRASHPRSRMCDGWSTIFINISGFMNLIRKSKGWEAEELSRLMYTEVMPVLLMGRDYITCEPPEMPVYDVRTLGEYMGTGLVFVAYTGVSDAKHSFVYGSYCGDFYAKYGELIQEQRQFDIIHIEPTVYYKDIVARIDLVFNGECSMGRRSWVENGVPLSCVNLDTGRFETVIAVVSSTKRSYEQRMDDEAYMARASKRSSTKSRSKSRSKSQK